MSNNRLTLEERAEALADSRTVRRAKRGQRPMRVSGKKVFELKNIITKKGH